MISAPTGKLELREGDVAPAVLEALGSVVTFARTRLAAPDVDPTIAVHESRKAMRRARSLLRMLRPTLSKTVRKKVEQAFSATHKKNGDKRDVDARQVAWKEFAERNHFDVPEVDEAFIPPPFKVPRATAAERAALDSAMALLAERLPPEITTDDLRRGLKATYRSARRELKRAQNVPDPVHVHALRRRCKDLHNQLELISSISTERAAAAKKRFGALAKAIGAITDLYMVQAGLDDVWRAMPELGPELKRELDRAIDREVAERIEAALADAEDALAKRPNKFSDRFGL